MILEYIRYALTSSKATDLIEAYTKAGEHLQQAPECLGYDLTRCEEAPMTFILRILWRSANDHKQGFRRGPNFPPFLSLIQPLVSEIVEMRHYAITGVQWARSDAPLA